MDIPPDLQERIVCSIAAAVRYRIPANIMLAVAEKEGGKPGQWVGNANGTHDVGPLQFNTGYLRQLSAYGIRPADVSAAGCYPYQLAAWRLRQHIKQDSGDIWTRCANYHSRTPKFNAKYRADLIQKSTRWAEWLDGRYRTQSILGGEVVATKNRLYPITKRGYLTPSIQIRARLRWDPHTCPAFYLIENPCDLPNQRVGTVPHLKSSFPCFSIWYAINVLGRRYLVLKVDEAPMSAY